MLEVCGVDKTYEAQPLLQNISFVVGASETICLLGPSGSGKSTLLRMIAGLEFPDAGRILWNGMDLASTPPHLRDFGLVFQDYALFPHLNVFDNVAFGLKMKDRSSEEMRARVAEVLDLVSLRGFDHRKVTDLSGGEQQRVALARALAPRPRLLLFDEPLGALDRALREDLLNELRGILLQTQIPAIYVTHDQEEAFTLAKRVLLLHDGQIVQQGAPADVWSKPNSVWVAQFLGLGNAIEGRVVDGKWRVETRFGVFTVKCAHRHQVGENLHLLIRPLAARAGMNQIRARVMDVVFQQDHFKITFDGGLYFYVKDEPKIGQKFGIKVKLECLG
ncbi:MAG TPA: ABC transporter ATP-binding protein [Anaerolineales bacterium]|nr:ABC transporter ATP-binding protein [Anaerolineales bacterium]